MRPNVKSISVLAIVFLSLSTESSQGQHPGTFMDTPKVDFNDCRQQTICTREFLPTVCMGNGIEVHGNNRCMSLMMLRNEACRRGLLIPRETVRCRQVSVRSALETD